MFFGNQPAATSQIYRDAAALVARTAPRAATIVEAVLLCAIAFAGGGLVAFSF